MGEEVKELAECSICTDLFTDPRMLPCIHTFCLKCLSDTAETTLLSPGNSMPCPLCRDPFVIPIDGMVGLKKNFFIERLVEISKVYKPSDSEIFCENCIEDDDEKATGKPTATNYCINCCKNICNRCCKEHRKYKELKVHQLVAIGSPLKEELMKKFAVHYCEQHNKKLYCLDCQKVICMACCVEEHNMHKCSNLDKMADTFREELKKDLEEIETISGEASEKSITTIKQQQNFQCEVESVEESIIKQSEKMKQFVDQCTSSLLEELSSIRNLGTKHLEIGKKENVQHKSIVESLKLYLMALISIGSSVDICGNARLLNNRCESLGKEHIEQQWGKIASREVSFDESNYLNLEIGINAVGSIKVKDFIDQKEEVSFDESNNLNLEIGVNAVDAITAKMKTKCGEKRDDDICVAIRSSLQLTASCIRTCGVSKMGNKIVVVCYDPSSIIVYDDQSPFQLQKKIETKEIMFPLHVAAIKKSKSLFISDGFNRHLKLGNRCIWKVTGEDYCVTKWLNNVDKPYTISSSPDGHLLVLRQTAPINRLEVYNPEGMLIQNFSLPVSILQPFSCNQTFNGEFIVSHKDGETNRWTISKLNNSGQDITQRFQPMADFGIGFVPPSLFLDIIGDLLFVTDYDNNGVLLLDPSSLQVRQVLLKESTKFSGPLGLICDSLRQQLFVQYRGRVVAHIFD